MSSTLGPQWFRHYGFLLFLFFFFFGGGGEGVRVDFLGFGSFFFCLQGGGGKWEGRGKEACLEEGLG